jgi:hypothetical protein
MNKLVQVLMKVGIWLKVNLATLINAVQLLIKALKEVLTAIVNLLSLFLPTIAAQKVVLAIRAGLEIVDGWLEKLKEYFKLVPII